MSRFYGRITPGNGRPVQRQGHSLHGLNLHAAGAVSGIEVQARAEGSVDVFEVYATDGYRTSESRYARTLLGTYRADSGWTAYPPLCCPECGETVWDGPSGHKLAKCWNTEGHASGGTLAFDTLD